jgi:hypothetical protein
MKKHECSSQLRKIATASRRESKSNNQKHIFSLCIFFKSEHKAHIVCMKVNSTRCAIVNPLQNAKHIKEKKSNTMSSKKYKKPSKKTNNCSVFTQKNKYVSIKQTNTNNNKKKLANHARDGRDVGQAFERRCAHVVTRQEERAWAHAQARSPADNHARDGRDVG